MFPVKYELNFLKLVIWAPDNNNNNAEDVRALTRTGNGAWWFFLDGRRI
jgi:hypothetical protein